MIADIQIYDKSYGDKTLYSGLEFKLNANEKIGLIGRNGTGKTTLFNILTGADTDFAGDVNFRKNLVVIDSRQEHHGFEDTPILEYILDDLPEYGTLKHILDTYPATMGSSMKKMEEYSEALERFTVLGYFDVEEEIQRSLTAYQISSEKQLGTIGQLSGGQKRFIELVKVQHARADLALIDEPTNHMDFIAKERFLDWFKATKEAVVVITHDRDVLRHVDRIVRAIALLLHWRHQRGQRGAPASQSNSGHTTATGGVPACHGVWRVCAKPAGTVCAFAYAAFTQKLKFGLLYQQWCRSSGRCHEAGQARDRPYADRRL